MFFPTGSREVAAWLRGLRVNTRARAAGVWLVETDHLRQLAFDVALDMPRDVAREFASATLEVPLAGKSLGIIAAATTGQPAVSIATELPADAGSGYWLRAFATARSIAVPVEREGRVVVVVSVALSALDPPSDVIAAAIRSETLRANWLDRV